MSQLKQQEIIKLIRPIIINSWNFNNNEQCVGAIINFAYIPIEFDYLDLPKIRFSLAMKNGRVQNSLNCDKYFVEFIDDILNVTYRYLCKDV